MKILLYPLLMFLILSCEGDINDSDYRNSNYVFYSEDGKTGVWRKLNNNSNFKYDPGTRTYFFDDGKIFAKTEILDSFSDRIEFYYNQNKIVATYFYKNNTLDSTVNKDGFQIDYKTNKRVVNAKGLFFNNLEQGEWIENNDEGILERIVHYKDGVKHGDYKEFYKSGKLKTFGNLWNGKKQDTLSWFYENGELESQEITELDTISGQSTGFVYWFYESGKLHKRIPLINEKQNGLVEIFYESGKFEAKSEYTDGLMNGNGIGYYESGVISYKGKVIKNNVHGDFKYYNEYGELIKIENYNNGQLLDSIVY